MSLLAQIKVNQDRINAQLLQCEVNQYRIAVENRLNIWVAAAGGHEPVTVIDGQHWQYMYNPALREHAYYCYDTDLFPEYNELPACLRGA